MHPKISRLSLFSMRKTDDGFVQRNLAIEAGLIAGPLIRTGTASPLNDEDDEKGRGGRLVEKAWRRARWKEGHTDPLKLCKLCLLKIFEYHEKFLKCVTAVIAQEAHFGRMSVA